MKKAHAGWLIPIIILLMLYFWQLNTNFFYSKSVVNFTEIQNDYNNSVANPQYFHIGDKVFLSNDNSLFLIDGGKRKKVYNKRTVTAYNDEYQIYSFLHKGDSRFWERDLYVCNSDSNEPIITIDDAKSPQLVDHYLFYLCESKENPFYDRQVHSNQNTLYCHDILSGQTLPLLNEVSSYFIINNKILFTKNGTIEHQKSKRTTLYIYELNDKNYELLMDIQAKSITNYFFLNDTVIFTQKDGIYQIDLDTYTAKKIYSDDFDGLANVYNNKLYLLRTDENNRTHFYATVDLLTGEETPLFNIQTLGIPSLIVLNDEVMIVKTIDSYFAIENEIIHKIV